MRQAQLDQTKTFAAAVQKDLINILLANLVHERNADGKTKAMLDALSTVFSKYERAAQKERQGLGDNEGELGRRMKDRFERLKRQFVDLDQTLGEAMDLLAPRSLSVFPTTRRSSRESDMARYSSNSPDRDEQGRFVSDDDRDPLATRAVAVADRAGIKNSASLRMISVDRPEVRVEAGVDRVGTKRAAS